jgi:hypothetical protein
VGLATVYYFLSECCCLKFAVLFVWGVLSDERPGLQFAMHLLKGPSRTKPVSILYCLIRDSPNLEAQVPVFISPQDMPPGTGMPVRCYSFQKVPDSGNLLRLIGMSQTRRACCVEARVPLCETPEDELIVA